MSDPARSDAPFDLTTERLEAFSDAVIAVIITILALGLQIPHGHLLGDDPRPRRAVPDLRARVREPRDLVEQPSSPAAGDHPDQRRRDVGEHGVAVLPVVDPGRHGVARATTSRRSRPRSSAIVSLCAAVAYSVLVRTIIRANGRDSVVARSLHGDTKGLVSIGLFAAGVAIATLSAWIPIGEAAAAAVVRGALRRGRDHLADPGPAVPARPCGRRLRLTARPSAVTPPGPRRSRRGPGVGCRAAAAGTPARRR